ncbi:hypothetical protein M405DRAFT_895044 [Rhizopogon salebrosus TDB-379]|nr:hypothetical protein M405DRAFT_895044 [Rhizopogon salebrosus TDB-379]
MGRIVGRFDGGARGRFLRRASIVDVLSMAVVPAPQSCRCAALSYLQGGIREERWTTKKSQAAQQTRWPIDALCIVKTTKDKAMQIGIMELIYGRSAFTIFAGANISASTSPFHPSSRAKPSPAQPYFQRMLAPKFSIDLSTWGTTSPRDAMIQHFMNNVGVAMFLVGLKAGGVALNLTEVSRVYLTDSR